MSTGAILLSAISVVAVSDMLIALYFRSVADRVESGETVQVRKVANMMFIFAPVMWLVVALISFGVIPSGIETISKS